MLACAGLVQRRLVHISAERSDDVSSLCLPGEVVEDGPIFEPLEMVVEFDIIFLTPGVGDVGGRRHVHCVGSSNSCSHIDSVWGHLQTGT